MTTIVVSTGSMTQEQADKQQEVVRKIMAERKLDYGPAIDYYIKQQKVASHVDTMGYAASHLPLFKIMVGND